MRRLFERIRQKYCDRKLLLEIFIFLNLVRLGLRCLPFPTLQKLLEKASRFSPKTSERLSVGKIVWAVETSSRYMPGGIKCLARALTTQTLMKQHSHVGELRIGVAKGETGELEAHAWVEHRGRIVIGYLNDLARYIPMSSFQGSRS
ncbi:MAG TPA: lasso peptide biosynthesis B2 protein [Oscillatoriales cyanobacterium M59_W2019_021]|nr:MAG: lasso peptide biosynthesis B2 protein [Cyanobacteria bacterium J055]HIK29962.1 lasso peptide biosynthesis B2 protein [Oscillatoriales cyanobacterium M4454_W2019_049]HIK51257.1 lasso peptide biosynthesis B2 protein [Oscillatoriales cyanobacterium M59_W2019_021]